MRVRGILYGNVILWKQNYKTGRKLKHHYFYIKYHSPYACVRTGCSRPYKTCTLHEYFSDEDTEASPIVLAVQLLDFHMKTLTYSKCLTVSLLTLWPDNYLLFMKWKWIIKVFTPFSRRVGRGEGGRRVGHGVSGLTEVGEADPLCITLWKYTVVSDFFAFHFSQYVSIQ